MSYAEAAARGPKQSPEEARAPAPPQVVHDEGSVSSLIDVDSPHVSSVPSDYESQSVKTDTQALRIEHEEEDKQREEERKKAAAKAKAHKGGKKIKENVDNPVVLGNAVAVVGLGSVLGWGAYRKYIAGELSWKVVGAWAGIVGLFAAGDYYLSKYLFRKYPTK
ncbi:hypothetical protein L228DRAFT_246141 [Xylona heveae TC161]|uniref:Uncharacterized protein n=1 Tax=Xylona heveae (strain CBS 132557 / TC161) TaxID=1328760 RepID=A0A165HE69_XYLHT|nr:hypothetical protein L228DRAFT_246141 [Xylona heveae TC161]KZF23375.1 hypothetical protein L228DRAFT_246141 [Xylona heveae TC161]